MNPLELNKNKSTIFLLPLVLADNIKHDIALTEDFVNTYIADVDTPENDDKLLMLKGKYIYVNEFATECKENLSHFLAGFYSQFTAKAKARILDFWEEDEKSDLYKVLHKQSIEAEVGRMEEVFPPPDLSAEILGIGEL